VTVEVFKMVVPVRGVVGAHIASRDSKTASWMFGWIRCMSATRPSVRLNTTASLLPMCSPDHAAAVPVQLEASVLEVQPMHADPPRQARPRGGRFVYVITTFESPLLRTDLYARILEHVVAVRPEVAST
jgi:hypothetical protein